MCMLKAPPPAAQAIELTQPNPTPSLPFLSSPLLAPRLLPTLFTPLCSIPFPPLYKLCTFVFPVPSDLFSFSFRRESFLVFSSASGAGLD